MELGEGGGMSKKMERKTSASAQTGWANRFGRYNLYDKLLQCSVEQLCPVQARKLVIFIDGLDTYLFAVALKRRYFSNINLSEVLRLGPRTNLVIAVPGSIKRKKKIIECLWLVRVRVMVRDNWVIWVRFKVRVLFLGDKAIKISYGFGFGFGLVSRVSVRVRVRV